MQRLDSAVWSFGVVLAIAASATLAVAQNTERTRAVKSAADELAAAEKAVADLEKAAANAEGQIAELTKARTVAEQTRVQKKAEARNASAKVAIARANYERLHAEALLQDAADAQARVLVAESQQMSAESALLPKTVALQAANAAAMAAQATAEKSAAEVEAARAAFGKVTGSAKAATEQQLKQKTAAAQSAALQLSTTRTAAAKAAAEKDAAERDFAVKGQAIERAMATAAIAKAMALGGLKPLSPAAWDYAKARHLLYRSGFGGTPDEVATLHARGLHRAVSSLVNYSRTPVPANDFDAVPPERPEPYEGRMPASEQNLINQRRQTAENEQLHRMRTWWLKRMVESPRPLQEKLTLFWHGHFASEYETILNSYLMYRQHVMFRTHANGNFGYLLRGLVHDATMLRYLNNDTNVKGHPNENLAREIMELFALGIGNYTEGDIREAARALTGYTYEPSTGEFRFVVAQHDPGTKTIFGNSGNWTGDELVDLILQQPATARFIAQKLIVYFVYPNPDANTIDRLASVLRANNFELAPTLENLFASEEFYSPKAVGAQIKSPIQLVVGALRELGVKDANYSFVTESIRNMGQDLFQPPNVKGWTGGRTWIDANRVFVRYNAMAELLESVPRSENRRGLDVLEMLSGDASAKQPPAIVEALARRCLAVPLNDCKRRALAEFIQSLPPREQWQSQRDQVNAKLTALIALLMAMPEYHTG